MSKVRGLIGGGKIFFCPGCRHTHSVNSHPQGPKWDYNNNPEKPTFSPSILVTTRWSDCEDEDFRDKDDVCHSFVRKGMIQFLGDCTHELAGQTVEIPEWPYEPGKYGGLEDATF